MEWEKPKSLVLVIDNDFNARQFYKQQLSKWGVNYEMETRGYLGLRKLNYHHTVVLLGMALPDLHGLSLIHKIRERYDFLATIPIVAVSHGGDEEVDGGVGINAWMEKPLHSDSLGKVLKKYIKINL